MNDIVVCHLPKQVLSAGIFFEACFLTASEKEKLSVVIACAKTTNSFHFYGRKPSWYSFDLEKCN